MLLNVSVPTISRMSIVKHIILFVFRVRSVLSNREPTRLLATTVCLVFALPLHCQHYYKVNKFQTPVPHHSHPIQQLNQNQLCTWHP